MKLVDVEMQDVELIGKLANAIEHQHVIRNRIADVGIEPQCLRGTAHQLCGGDRIRTGKQRYVVTQPDQFICKVGYHTLGPAIELRRHALDEGRDLCNFHWWELQQCAAAL
jgi:ABC-type microcin C transport system duplicated ATPase subunit YejF